MNTALSPFERIDPDELDIGRVAAIISVVTDTVDSAHTKRAYTRAIRDFLDWFREAGQTGLNKATVQRYATHLRAQGIGASSVNQRLSAIRKLAREAVDNGALSTQAADGIRNVKGLRQTGQRMGFWLQRDEAQALLDAPEVSTIRGLRDRALLAVMLGCGLRRAEVASLTFTHVQQRDGRWLIIDLVGKRNRTRSVVMPAWVKEAIEAWSEAAGIQTGRIFRSVNKGSKVSGRISAVGVSWVVKQYGESLGLPHLAAHDLRRTFAKLARSGGAELEQIQLTLGHASLTTTERYLGSTLDLQHAPGDMVGLVLAV